jgi:hypothetical protein
VYLRPGDRRSGRAVVDATSRLLATSDGFTVLKCSNNHPMKQNLDEMVLQINDCGKRLASWLTPDYIDDRYPALQLLESSSESALETKTITLAPL